MTSPQSTSEIKNIHKRLISHIREYSTKNSLSMNENQNETVLNDINMSEFIFPSNFEEDCPLNFKCNEEYKINIGSKLILEIFEIYKSSFIKILHDLINENLKIKDDLKLVYNFIELLHCKTEKIINKNSEIKLHEYNKNVDDPYEYNFEDCINSFKNKV